MSRTRPTVDIVMSVYDGLPWVVDQVRSLQRQTWPKWRLHVRDDGSADDTWARLAEMAERDPRIRLRPRDGTNLGVVRGFGRLIEELPEDSAYVFCCDADDVWLPEKIERSMEVMRGAEDAGAGPVLVHSDLTVVDERLNVISPSFWRYQGIRPEPVALPRLIVQNVATGPTLLLNRALRERVGSIPAEALNHDWWITLVAAATGRIVAMDEPTVLYRQHGRNDVGAHSLADPGMGTLIRRLPRAWTRISRFRRSLVTSARQVEVFLERYGEVIEPADRAHLEAYAEIPRLKFLSRKRRLLEVRALPEHGLIRNLGVVLRG